MTDIAKKHGKRIERQDANMPTALRDMLSPGNYGTRRPQLIGIVNLWLRNVRWLGDSGCNKHFKPGTVGDLHVSEVGTDGRIINANFYPKDGPGFGATINPEWEYVPAQASRG